MSFDSHVKEFICKKYFILTFCFTFFVLRLFELSIFGCAARGPLQRSLIFMVAKFCRNLLSWLSQFARFS